MDAISYSYADKQAKRITKFNANPDSDSGIVTVPKVIEAGESVTVPAGRVAVLPNVQVDGEITVEAGAEIFIPAGSSVDFSTGIKVNGEKLTMSIPTAYHIYNGSVEATNTILTNGFSTTLYTGNGTTQAINTGVDMATQWGNDASETYGGLVWIKARELVNGTTAKNHILQDTVSGITTKALSTSSPNAQYDATTYITSVQTNGFTLGSSSDVNFLGTGNKYASWNFQTTHRISGVTNHGKPYTCHYNPYTGFTIIKYEGSGIGGHEIPHSLGRKLDFVTVKNLSAATDWLVNTSVSMGLTLNMNIAQSSGNNFYDITTNQWSGNSNVKFGFNYPTINAGSNTYIMYGWANSYFDEANKLIGNYEIGVYQGTGVAGNKVTTRSKPAWVMIKRLDAADGSGWIIKDNLRNAFTGTSSLFANTSVAETSNGTLTGQNDGFTTQDTGTSSTNTPGGQYLYMVVYDNDSGSGKSKYQKATDTTNLSINALVPYANGIDVNGSKVSIEYKNETITGLTLTQGKNYLYSKNDGTYGVSMIAPSYGIENPLTGDFFNLKTLKWYDSSNVEITPRTYLDCVVYADHNEQVTYVEELPKIEYKDVIKANEYQGKNACTAWVNFDGTTTPPTIRDSYNVSAVIRIGTGQYDIYFKGDMDNNKYSTVATQGYQGSIDISIAYTDKVYMVTRNSTFTAVNDPNVSVHINGGKN